MKKQDNSELHISKRIQYHEIASQLPWKLRVNY